MARPGSFELIRDVNTRYHDIAAAGYDAKWGIDFGEIGRRQVLLKVAKLVSPIPPDGFGRALEIGAGTGYFGLNLLGAGVVEELTCTDISPGMLAVLLENADRLGLHQVSGVTAESQALPFEDESFDLVLGHAVLHHLPDLQASFREFRRVLAPGGRILFAGEPSRIGDGIARLPKRASVLAAPLWRAAVGSRQAAPLTDLREGAEHELESQVDIHAFRPADLGDLAARAGFTEVTVRGEELLANWFGWFNRGLEATADAEAVPSWWRRYAFHGYLWLQKLDAMALEPHLPPAIFYNLLLTARRPA